MQELLHGCNKIVSFKRNMQQNSRCKRLLQKGISFPCAYLKMLIKFEPSLTGFETLT